LQAFGPALAGRGVAVLAPDAITFEDRRASASGVEPADGDWLQHYNAMAFRLVNGDLLMRKCLDDAQRAVSALAQHPGLGGSRPGVFGHSYGGTTALYLAAVDPRCRFAGVSGAVCSFQGRLRRGTGLNMFELVPGIARSLEVHDLLRAIGPRPSLVVSATEDPYSVDADEVVERAASEHVTHLRAQGGHALDQARFDAILEWLTRQAASTA
jgi:dienelactone hydrolase